MANTLKPKRSSTASLVPTTSNLASGELGVNMADQKIWINNGTSVIQIGAGKLSGHADVALTSLTSGQTLSWSGTSWVNTSAGIGTVTSIVAGTGLTGGTITSSGTIALATSGVAAGTYTKLTVDAYGRATTGAALASSDVTTALGFTPYNSTNPNGYTSNTGTITSVGGTGTVSGLTLTGTVTTTGDLALGGTLSVAASNFASQTANTLLIAPNGSAGVPTFRALVAADIPALTLENLPDAWVKRAVRIATTANITLSGLQTIDGITVVDGDRVLVKDQTTTSQNGIYLASSTAWTRATDANLASELSAANVSVDSGTTNGGLTFDTDFKATDTLDTTAMLWYRVVDTGLASSTSPAMNGTATVGTAITYARADHVHPVDTSRAAAGQTMYIGTTAVTLNRASAAITLTGITSIDGLSATATKLATARTINGVSFDGTANITVADATKLPLTGGTITTSGSSSSLTISDTGANGANLRLVGNGATTPNKNIRAASGNLEVVNSGYTAAILTLTDAGTLTIAGNVAANSDERIKKDWKAVAKDFVARLACVKSGTYTRIDTGERQAGSSAQDWQDLLPEVVVGDELLSLTYGNAALVSAVELAKEVVFLRNKVSDIESILQTLLHS